MHIGRFKTMRTIILPNILCYNLLIFFLNRRHNIRSIRYQIADKWQFQIFPRQIVCFGNYNTILYFQKITCITIQIICRLLHCNLPYFLICHFFYLPFYQTKTRSCALKILNPRKHICHLTRFHMISCIRNS